MKTAQGSMTQMALQAQTTFQRNVDTLIAMFLIRNPDVRPEDVELVMSANREGMKFSVQPKELYLPENVRVDGAPRVLNTNDKAMWVIGWNECRDKMIELARAARPQDALVNTLASTIVAAANG